MRLHSITSTIENGFVYLPDQAEWLQAYLHELTTFPNSKHDDQADSTSQALDWIKTGFPRYTLLDWYERQQAELSTPPGIVHGAGILQWNDVRSERLIRAAAPRIFNWRR
jgi:hypothetical protein